MATTYLDLQRDVDLMRRLQALQRCRGGVVVIRHRELARRLGVSVATVRRAIDAMVAAGHIVRTYISRPCGGRLAVYRVQLDVVYRRASTFRRARRAVETARGEHFVSGRNGRHDGACGNPAAGGVEAKTKNNNQYNRRAGRPSVDRVDTDDLELMLHQARLLGIDDHQRGWLRGAALRYGVMETWTALQIAYESGRYCISDLVRVTWGILRRKREEVMTA